MALTFLTICREGVSSSWNITPLLITQSRIYSLGEIEIFYVKLKNLKRCIAIFNLVNNISGGWNYKTLAPVSLSVGASTSYSSPAMNVSVFQSSEKHSFLNVSHVLNYLWSCSLGEARESFVPHSREGWTSSGGVADPGEGSHAAALLPWAPCGAALPSLTRCAHEGKEFTALALGWKESLLFG